MQSAPQLMLMMLSGSVRGAKHLQLMLMMLARLGQRRKWIRSLGGKGMQSAPQLMPMMLFGLCQRGKTPCS